MRVRFVAARSVYFWLGTTFWLAVAGYIVVSSTVLDILDGWWWPVGAALLVSVMVFAYGAARSGVAVEDGKIRVRDGFRVIASEKECIDEFVIVGSVAFMFAALVLYAFGPFEPDRLGIRWRDGSVQKLNWCFANHDDIRIIRKRLNQTLRERAE